MDTREVTGQTEQVSATQEGRAAGTEGIIDQVLKERAAAPERQTDPGDSFEQETFTAGGPDVDEARQGLGQDVKGQVPPAASSLMAAELAGKERGEYEIVIKGLRQAQRSFNTLDRDEIFTNLLGKLESGEHPESVWREHLVLERTLHPIVNMSISAKIISLGLQTMIAESRQSMDSVAQLRNLEADVRAIVDHLEPKAKAVIGMLERLSVLEGYNLGVDYGQKILHEELPDGDLIAQICRELPDDPDMPIVACASALAGEIKDAEN